MRGEEEEMCIKNFKVSVRNLVLLNILKSISRVKIMKLEIMICMIMIKCLDKACYMILYALDDLHVILNDIIFVINF